MFSMMPYYATRTVKPRTNNDLYAAPFGEDFFRSFFADRSGLMKVDVEDKDDHYLLETDLPGVTRDNVHISVEDGVLTIAVEQKEEKSEEANENHSYIYHERRSMSASRSFSLEGVDEENIRAAYIDGVLQLTLPKKAQQMEDGVRRIEIQ